MIKAGTSTQERTGAMLKAGTSTLERAGAMFKAVVSNLERAGAMCNYHCLTCDIPGIMHPPGVNVVYVTSQKSCNFQQSACLRHQHAAMLHVVLYIM